MRLRPWGVGGALGNAQGGAQPALVLVVVLLALLPCVPCSRQRVRDREGCQLGRCARLARCPQQVRRMLAGASPSLCSVRGPEPLVCCEDPVDAIDDAAVDPDPLHFGIRDGESPGSAASDAEVWFPDAPAYTTSTRRPSTPPPPPPQQPPAIYNQAVDETTKRFSTAQHSAHSTHAAHQAHQGHQRPQGGHTTPRPNDYYLIASTRRPGPGAHYRPPIEYRPDREDTKFRPLGSPTGPPSGPSVTSVPERSSFDRRPAFLGPPTIGPLGPLAGGEGQRTSWPRTSPSPRPSSRATPRPNSRPRPRPATISDKKCGEYAKLQTEKVVALPLVPDPRPSVQHVQKCESNSVPLVVGGQDARLHEFPHMAAIGYREVGPSGARINWNCGGSLISEMFVLTAAHCTATAQGPPIRVRLGEHNLESSEDGARPVDVAVSSMVRHPDYQPPARYDDIGLLRLARKVAFSAAVRPACLYSSDRDPNPAEAGPLVATGWGLTEHHGEKSQILQKVSLNFIDHRTCSNLYAADATTSVLARGIASDSQLCAGNLNGGEDTCQGDSGGPLQVTSLNNQCVFHIVGITSFGKVCAARNSPGVYTRVSKYISWIERHVWPEERLEY